jgi:hypothetical protein
MRFPLLLSSLLLLPLIQGAPAMALIDMLIEKFNESLSTHMREKLEPILKRRRTCHCQLVMMPPPMPWYHPQQQKTVVMPPMPIVPHQMVTSPPPQQRQAVSNTIATQSHHNSVVESF